MDTKSLYQALNQGLLQERYLLIKRNITRNKMLIEKWGGLQRVVGLLNGKHVVVCGAGTSLNEALKVLKKYQFRKELVIIATDMAYRPLVLSGIQPHFSISCEAVPMPYYTFLPTSSCHLLAFTGISSYTLSCWKGKISFYNWMIYESPFDVLWKIAGEHLGFVATASIVTTQAISLALGCSIASLILVGNDLAFKDNYYAQHTVICEKFMLSYTRFNTANSKDYAMIHKKKMYMLKRRESIYYTDHQFLAAKQWLEDLFRKVKIPVYDCSVPGCSENTVMKDNVAKVLAYVLDNNRTLKRGKR